MLHRRVVVADMIMHRMPGMWISGVHRLMVVGRVIMDMALAHIVILCRFLNFGMIFHSNSFLIIGSYWDYSNLPHR